MTKVPSQAPESASGGFSGAGFPGLAFPLNATNAILAGSLPRLCFRGELPTTSENLRSSATLPESDGTRRCPHPHPNGHRNTQKEPRGHPAEAVLEKNPIQDGPPQHTPPPRDTPAWPRVCSLHIPAVTAPSRGRVGDECCSHPRPNSHSRKSGQRD